jgi:DNA-binding transcriptional regulator YdaS (Cro superfamily)
MLLREYLFHRRINATKAAQEIGCSTPTLTRLLAGDRKVSLETGVKIEKWSNGEVSCADLLLEGPPTG